MRQKKFVKFSFLDFTLFSLEDVLSSVGIVITLRFKTRHGIKDIRDAMRYMLSIYPRLRSAVVPTLFSYKLRIFDDDDRQLEALFDASFKVRRNLLHDTEDYLECRRGLLNEPFSLEQGLPIKICYLPDDPNPVLLLSVHHIVCDGVGWIHMANSILSHLNGKMPPFVPLDNPSLSPALLEKPFYKIPYQMYKSFKILLKELMHTRKGRIANASSRPADFFGPVDMQQYFLPFDYSIIKTKTKELNCSVTVLLLTALTITLTNGPSKDNGNIIGALLSYDQRRFFDKVPPVFGNYVIAQRVDCDIRYCEDPYRLIKEIRTQMNKHISRFEQKEIIFHMLINKLCTFVGKKNYARAARTAKKRGRIPMTVAVSNLGNLDKMNSYGEKAQVEEAIATVSHQGLLMTFSIINGRINTTFLYQIAEFTGDEIKDLIHAFEQNLKKLLTV